MLANSLANPPEAVGHKRSGTGEVGGGAEATGGKVALVLDGAVAADGRHILRHDGGMCLGLNASSKRSMRSGEVRGARESCPGLGALISQPTIIFLNQSNRHLT